jgi:hypothetical protein
MEISFEAEKKMTGCEGLIINKAEALPEQSPGIHHLK